MIHVYCRTNLDLSGEKWPSYLPEVPRVGDYIQSATKHRGNFQLSLEVCRVTWRWCESEKQWFPEIELHMTSFQRGLPPPKDSTAAAGSIVAFYHWYAPLVGRSVGAFI